MLDHETQTVLTNAQSLLPWLITNAVNLLEAIAILLIGIWLAGRISRGVVRMLERMPHFDPMLRSFFSSLTRYLVLTVTVLAVLSQFGIQTTSLVAVLGAAGLAVGLALQGTLSNLAAGVMLLIFRPFKIGDKVTIGGMTGTVRDLSLFWTELITDDQIQIIVPNGGVWGTPLRNMSTYPAPSHAGEAHFRIPETADLDDVATKVLALITADTRVLENPAPGVIYNRTLAENALELVVSFATADDIGAAVRSDLIRSVQRALAADAKPEPAPAEGTPATPPAAG
jgi:small conductance mechanosensitive channel